jgi:DNA replication regulator DPB11
MGAIHKLDLTSDVTHLIVGNWDTPKYKYVAKERPDVRIIKPEWIEALREDWMNGDDVNVEALEDDYTVPTFADLKICLTGFDDGMVLRSRQRLYTDYRILEEDRRRLTEDINSNGGEWHADLTREVTHLIAAEAAGTKFRYAQKWGLRIVTREWCKDCIERGMILDENLYHPLLPVSERGKNAWIRRSASGTSLGKRARDNGAEGDERLGRRKLRRTASAKLSVQNSGIWTDIVGGGFSGNSGGMEVEEIDGLKDINASDFNAEVPQAEQNPRTTSRKYEERDKENNNPLAKHSNAATTTAHPNRKRGLFTGRKFYLRGFDEKKVSLSSSHLAFSC